MKSYAPAAALAAALLILVPVYASLSAQDSDKEELKLKLPKPMFIGTPRNIKTANLETITGKSRGPFFVPKGTRLLSAGKAVLSSDMQPVIGDLGFVVDGEKSGEDGYFVELGPGRQWVQIDLGKTAALHAILIWHYHSQARVYRDVVVQASDDKDFRSNVLTVYNNDHDNTLGFGPGKDKEYIETNEGRLIDPKGAAARYLRLHSNGNTSNDMNHYVEVEVYGILK
ncbi:MAG: hypothetical protein PHF93_09975 [Acidobacteriota bacterium]|nr:hypothetical protein [Acidobacteriota bacterium]MDD8034133.1 hypothetical protein [Acidobacteriota bacterium]MDW3227424.1 hypothetical protein [Acidobacteriota bacterium]NMD11074.1 hypothetical protein [Acidobacteriota bacterium]